MEMETRQIPESGIHQKPGPEINENPPENGLYPEKELDQKPEPEVNESPPENGLHPEKELDQMPGSEVDEEPVETCQGEVVEIDINSEKHAVPEARLEANQKPMETCQETAVETDINQEKKTTDTGVIYRCRRCRRMLATHEYVVTHEVGRGFRTKADEKPECMCIFVEPMKWMEAVEEGYVSHKLYCMGCKALLGQFNWAGMQCTCGTWVVPAFQLTKSKIDECTM